MKKNNHRAKFGGKADNTLGIIVIIQTNDYHKLSLHFQKSHSFFGTNFSVNPNPNQYKYVLPPDNLTLLHIAAIYDSLECFIFLLSQPNFHTRILSGNSLFPFHYACFYGSFEVFSYILQTDPTILSVKQPSPYSFLAVTIPSGNPIMLELLFQNGIEMDKDHYSLFQLCLKYRSAECVKILSKFIGNNYVKTGHTLLMDAALYRSPEILQLLIPTQSNITYVNEKGESIFSILALNGIDKMPQFKNVILSLLERVQGQTIEPDSTIHCKGVCHWICQLLDFDIAKAMLNTAKVQINRLDHRNNHGLNELTVKSPEKTNDMIKLITLLMNHGLNLNARAPKVKGVYPSPSILENFCISLRPNIMMIQFLIEVGADVNALVKNSRDVTLIDYMCKKPTQFQSFFQTLKQHSQQ